MSSTSHLSLRCQQKVDNELVIQAIMLYLTLYIYMHNTVTLNRRRLQLQYMHSPNFDHFFSIAEVQSKLLAKSFEQKYHR